MTLYIGEISAILTAVCWAVCSSYFESAGKKVGSFNLNFTRLIFGILFLSTFTFFYRGQFFPTDVNAHSLKWLSFSGFVGIVLGDIFLFESFVRVGARMGLVVQFFVPPLSAILSYLFLKESISINAILGMILTLIGIFIVIFKPTPKNKTKITEEKTEKSYTHKRNFLIGVSFSFIAAFFQASSNVISKHGLTDYDPFASAQIRLFAAFIAFIVIYTVKNHWPTYIQSLKNKEANKQIFTGSFFGPFIGISLMLVSVKHINPGISATLSSTAPIIMLPYAYFIKKEKVSYLDIIGTVTALIGITIIFLYK